MMEFDIIYILESFSNFLVSKKGLSKNGKRNQLQRIKEKPYTGFILKEKGGWGVSESPAWKE